MNTQKNRYNVLVVDDEPPIRSLLQEYLNKQDFSVFTADSVTKALEIFKQVQPDVVVTDIRMQKQDGIALIKNIKKLNANVPVIIITAYPSIESAVEAIRENAFDYLIKPFNLSELTEKIKSAVDIQNLTRDNLILKEMASLHKVTSLLASTRDSEKLLDVIMEQCIKNSRADIGSIQLIDSSGKDLIVEKNVGIPYSKKISPLDDFEEWPIAKWVCRNKHPMLLKEGKLYPHVDISVTKDIAFRSGVFIPLLANETLIGVLNLVCRERAFTDIELQIIHVLASQAGVAINNARLYDKLKDQLGNLTLINEYSEYLMEKIEKGDIFKLFFSAIKNNFFKNINFAAVLFLERDKHQLAYYSPYNVSEPCIYQFKKAAIEEIKEHKKINVLPKNISVLPYNISNSEKENVTIKNIPYLLKMPLFAHENFIGSVFIGAKDENSITPETSDQIAAIINQTCIALINAKLYDEMKENYFKTIRALAIAVDAKDAHTGGHSELVAKYAGMMAREMKLSEKEILNIENAGIIHDVGKIGIPGHILNKPGLLTTEEFNSVMKSHSALGANIIKEVPFLQELYPLILYHHERYNGTGYPEGLRENKIPVGAKILAVADVFAAMISDRPHRKSLGEKESYKHIVENRGVLFDPDVVDIFKKIVSCED